MSHLLKIDFHTHPIEALKEKMGITGIRDINREVAGLIVAAVKSSGLNGIAITEHNNFNHSWVASLEIRDYFRHENLIILPGVEIDYQGQQFLQIYISDYYRKHIPFFKGQEWLMVLAHPGLYQTLDPENINNVAFDAVEEKSGRGEFPLSGQIASSRNIPLIRSSDAHRLEDIGLYYTEIASG